MDSSGNVLSTFPFQAGSYGAPSAAAVDPQDNLWIVGSAVSGSAANAPLVGFIAKLDSTGANLLFTGAFGGLDPKGYTRINAIAFDPAGNLYLGGSTFQVDFPVTPGAFISQAGTAPAPAGYTWNGAPQYGFIAKLTQADQTAQPYTLAYSTLLGGQRLPSLPKCSVSGPCSAWPPATTVSALTVDANGVVTAAGATDATDFPVTPGAFQTQYEGQAYDVNAFITRLNAGGASLAWSTLLGAPSLTGSDSMTLSGMAVDSSGGVVVTGTTDAPSLPVTAGALQPHFANPQGNQLGPVNGFVAKLDSTGASLLFSTYYGIDNNLSPPRLDSQGDIWITGSVSNQTGLALHPNSLVLLPNGVAGEDLAMNPDSSLTVAGTSQAVGLNLLSGFVLRLPRGTPTGVSILGVAHSAVNAVTDTVAPGEFLSIYGREALRAPAPLTRNDTTGIFRFTVTIQVGSSQSPSFPLYAITGR